MQITDLFFLPLHIEFSVLKNEHWHSMVLYSVRFIFGLKIESTIEWGYILEGAYKRGWGGLILGVLRYSSDS